MLWLLIWCCFFIVKLSNCMSSSCAPPPPTLCDVLLCHVMCSHPPQAWGLPSCCCCCYCWCLSGSSVISVFWGKLLWFCWVFNLLFLLPFPSNIASETVQGMPPTLPLFPKTTCFIFSSYTHTHTHKRNLYPPMCLIPALSHPYCTYSENPTTHSFKPTHPLIPPSFFRFQLGWFNHHKQLGYIHSIRAYVFEDIYDLDYIKWIKKKKWR